MGQQGFSLQQLCPIQILLIFLTFKLPPNFIFQCDRHQTWQFYLFFPALFISGIHKVSGIKFKVGRSLDPQLQKAYSNHEKFGREPTVNVVACVSPSWKRTWPPSSHESPESLHPYKSPPCSASIVTALERTHQTTSEALGSAPKLPHSSYDSISLAEFHKKYLRGKTRCTFISCSRSLIITCCYQLQNKELIKIKRGHVELC